MDTDLQARILAAFPFLAEAEVGLRDRLFEVGRTAHLDAGQFICMEGNRCQSLALVLSGSARVYKTGERGREITLYRIEPGESCILTASCILSDSAFPAFAVIEDDVDALLIPAYIFRQWTARYETWQGYVFGVLSRRLATVIAVVEEVTFRRLDARLAGLLLGAGGPVVEATHEALAADVGSAREVVSRVLKEFEHEGLVALSRGAVRVLDPAGLGEKARKT